MKFIKRFFKSIDVAFSMYSRIPMPRFEWASDDMKYHLCFFPWVGAVIGAAEYGWKLLAERGSLGSIIYCAVAIVLPIVITGGFHVDGFMDTMDALHSYQDQEKKREILKDPHIGAFAVISLAVCLLLAFGFVSEINVRGTAIVVMFSFFISRCLSGLSVTLFPKAKKDGMLYMEASTSDKKVVIVSLIVQLILCAALMLFITLPETLAGIFAICAMFVAFIWCYFMCKRQFGGISGDISGFFVVVSELVAVVCAAVCSILGL